MKEQIKALVADDWYIQALPARPLFLNSAAVSGIRMGKILGIEYKKFLIHYRHDYAEGCYWQPDMDRLWREFYSRFQRDSKYLSGVKSLYIKNLEKYSSVNKYLEPNILKSLPEKKLLHLFRTLVEQMCDSIGVAHLIEAIGLKMEEKIKEMMLCEARKASPSELNKLAVFLTTPKESSYLCLEEQELKRIIKSKDPGALQKHYQRYGWWLGNSYFSPKKLSLASFQKRGRELLQTKAFPKKRGRSYSLGKRKGKEFSAILDAVHYLIMWQDERKAISLQSISRLGSVAREIARRLSWSVTEVYYLGYSEAKSITSFTALKRQRALLRARRKGSFWLLENREDRDLSGLSYRRIFGSRFSMIQVNHQNKDEEIHGTVANGGTTRGPVRIIKKLEDIRRMKQGEILVTSMTRPEYMTAIKKAGALVTDEGGITCHAAIISRELNIPAVIGTKNATRILKDGQMVLVRASHGVVKPI